MFNTEAPNSLFTGKFELLIIPVSIAKFFKLFFKNVLYYHDNTRPYNGFILVNGTETKKFKYY